MLSQFWARAGKRLLLVTTLILLLSSSGCARPDDGARSTPVAGASPKSPGAAYVSGDSDAEADAELATKAAPPLKLADGRTIAPGSAGSAAMSARSAAVATTQAATPQATIQAIVDAWQSTTEVAGTGVSVAVVQPLGPGSDQATVATYYAGNTQVGGASDAPNAVSASTLFEIGSETKTFTGALLAQLLSSGQVSLSDPLSKYAPPGVVVPSWNAGGNQVPITLGNLATHQSGLPRVPANLGTDPTAKQNYTEALMWQAISDTALLWEPGTNWLYSNFGFGVLGTVLANVAQPGSSTPPFGQVVKSALTGPATMSATGLENCSPQTCPQTPGLATPYLQGDKPAPYWNNTGAIAGAGGLVSNANDMGTWVADALGYQSPISSFASQPTKEISQVRTICTNPKSCKQASFSMGMAWQLYQKGDWINEPFAFKNGGTAGMHSATYLLTSPNRRLAVTVLTNSPNPAQVSQLGQYIVTALT